MRRLRSFVILLLIAALVGALTEGISGETKTMTCRLHGVFMRQDKVPVIYGRSLTPEFEEVRKAKFPNAHSFVIGQPFTKVEKPEPDHVYFCPKCRAAESRWKEKHPDGIFAEQSNNGMQRTANQQVFYNCSLAAAADAER